MEDKFQISLRAARVNAGYTVEEVAKILHRGQQTVRNWETGKTAIPGIELQQLCELYGCPAKYIFLQRELS